MKKLLFALALSCAAAAADFASHSTAIKNLLAQSISAFLAGDRQRASALANEAYFAHYSQLLASLAARSQRAYLLEAKFINLRQLYKHSAIPQAAQVLVAQIRDDLDELVGASAAVAANNSAAGAASAGAAGAASAGAAGAAANNSAAASWRGEWGISTSVWGLSTTVAPIRPWKYADEIEPDF